MKRIGKRSDSERDLWIYYMGSGRDFPYRAIKRWKRGACADNRFHFIDYRERPTLDEADYDIRDTVTNDGVSDTLRGAMGEQTNARLYVGLSRPVENGSDLMDYINNKAERIG